MNMEKQWLELKTFLRNKSGTGFDYLDALKKMEEIERRSLPERVAELLEKTDVNRQFCRQLDLTSITYARYGAVKDAFEKIAKALRTGDLTELQKWVK